MAGPDTKLSQQNTTVTTTGGYLHIILPDGGGGWESWRIATSAFQQTEDRVTDKLVNQSAPLTVAFDAGEKLESIDFSYQSGTPKIKIGTTLGGTEISLAELPVPSGDYLPVNIDKIFTISTTVYITISGGVVNLNINYRTNYF